MGSILLDVAFVGAGSLVGGLAGWFVRGGAKHSAPPEPAKTQEPVIPAISANEVNDLVGRLQDLTIKVAADVDEHSNRVQDFNAELTHVGANQNDIVAVVSKIIRANEQMQSQLRQAELKLSEQAKEIENHVSEARTDALTRLNNRRAFDDVMKRCREEFQAKGRATTVMMIDVDFFKKFNDTYGHQAGDEVLRTVARTLRKHLPERDVICRYGGEEFAVIFPGTDLKNALPGAERARVAINEAKVEFEGRTLKVTASAGIAEFINGENEQALVKRADGALYASKEAGRNCAHWNDGKLNQRITNEKKDVKDTRREPAAIPTSEVDTANEARQQILKTFSDKNGFLGDVERRLAEWKRGGTIISILLIHIDDFDRFANVNGKNYCNTVLGITAQFLKAAMRDMDHIARVGDSTFGLTLPTAKITDALAVGERVRKAIERGKIEQFAPNCRLTVSVGVAECQPTDDAAEIFERARESMDEAVTAGGNRCVVLATAKTT